MVLDQDRGSFVEIDLHCIYSVPSPVIFPPIVLLLPDQPGLTGLTWYLSKLYAYCTFSVPSPTVIFLTNLVSSKCNIYLLKSLFVQIVQCICSNCMRIDCTFSVPCPTVIFPPLRAAITITPTNLETESEKNVDSKILGSGGENKNRICSVLAKGQQIHRCSNASLARGLCTVQIIKGPFLDIKV